MGIVATLLGGDLKQLSTKLKSWNKSKQFVTEEEKKAWIKEIYFIDKLESKNKITKSLSLRRTAIKADLSQKAFKETQM